MGRGAGAEAGTEGGGGRGRDPPVAVSSPPADQVPWSTLVIWYPLKTPGTGCFSSRGVGPRGGGGGGLAGEVTGTKHRPYPESTLRYPALRNPKGRRPGPPAPAALGTGSRALASSPALNALHPR